MGFSVKRVKDEEEKEEQSRKLKSLNKSKYVLLKNEIDLNLAQKEKLEEAKCTSLSLKVMQELKEEIRSIFERVQNWEEAILQLSSWLSRASTYFRQSVSTIRRWLPEIIAYFDHRTNSGVVEGVNNKIKLIKRSAYGFRNFLNFQARCWLTWQYS